MGTLVNEYLGIPVADSFDESASSNPGRPGKAKKPRTGRRKLEGQPTSTGPDTPNATKQGRPKTALPKATKQIIPRAKKSAWSPCRLCGRPVLKQQAQPGGLCVDCLARKRRQTIVGPTPKRKRRKSYLGVNIIVLGLRSRPRRRAPRRAPSPAPAEGIDQLIHQGVDGRDVRRPQAVFLLLPELRIAHPPGVSPAHDHMIRPRPGARLRRIVSLARPPGSRRRGGGRPMPG